MASLTGWQISTVARRLVTLLPALVVLLAGADPTRVLVVSQVVLSMGIPFALVPLVRFTSRSDLMGAHVNTRVTTWTASGVAAIVIVLNAALLVLTFTSRWGGSSQGALSALTA